MNCDQWRDRALDVLYGEQVEPRDCYDFFRHLENCSDCDAEYQHLLEARDWLSEWTLDQEPLPELPDVSELGPAPLRRVWNHPALFWLRQAAAAVVITLGLFTLVQQARLLGEDRVEVSEQELVEMVNDLIVQHEMSERRLIGQEWMDFADDLNLRQQVLARDVAQRLYELEERYLVQLEENNQYLQALYTR